MRKAWLLLLVVALTAVSVSAFADTAPAAGWTAWNQGNFYPYASLNGATAVAGWGPNYDGAGPGAGGIDQEWTFAYSGKNYGFNATAEWGSLDAFGWQQFREYQLVRHLVQVRRSGKGFAGCTQGQ